MITKHCRRCDTTKIQTDFNKSRSARDGLQKYCRECTRMFSRQNKERNAARDRRTMKPYQEQKFASISEEELLNYLRKFTEENDRPPTTEDLENNPDYSCAYTYYRRFIYKASKEKKVENWNAILNLADIDIVDYFSLWRAWEYLVERSVQVFESDYLFQYAGLSDDFRPDIVIPSKKLIIDAATSNYSSKLKKRQYENARMFGYDVEYWCLYKTTANGLNQANLKYVFADEIIARLKTYGEAELIQKIELIHQKHKDYQNERLFYKKEYYKSKLNEFVEKFNRNPTTRDFINNADFPSTTSLCTAFGSFNKALEYAGIGTFSRDNINGQ